MAADISGKAGEAGGVIVAEAGAAFPGQKNRGYTWPAADLMKKLIALLVVLALVAAAAWIAFAADYSDGYRVGQVIKLSRSGYVFKTWEGTLDFGFLQQDPVSGVATRLWDFSLRDADRGEREGQALLSREVFSLVVFRRHQAFRLSARAGWLEPDLEPSRAPGFFRNVFCCR
jgi:hypothetical protein